MNPYMGNNGGFQQTQTNVMNCNTQDSVNPISSIKPTTAMNNDVQNFRQNVSNNKTHKCRFCGYASNKVSNVKRHETVNHNNQNFQIPNLNQNHQIPNNPTTDEVVNKRKGSVITTNGYLEHNKLNKEEHDVRLKENFKLFISGPSRCGKTFFVSELLENINSFAKKPPSTIVYVYKVWQTKFDEMKSIVHMFIKDNENVVNQIKRLARGQSIFVIFDDLLNSSSLPDISNLFTVDGRHMNMSMAFLTQRMFVNNEHFRQISQNCDYFVIFKNPRNSSEIRTLAQQITPGSLDLVDIYINATQKPFSYLFINLTQECPPKGKYLSSLFDTDHKIKVYVKNERTNKFIQMSFVD